MPPAPPSGAEHLLRAAVRDPEWRDAVLGDLAEEYARVGQRCGVHRARRWYWRQALAIAAVVGIGGWLAWQRLAPIGRAWISARLSTPALRRPVD